MPLLNDHCLAKLVSKFSFCFWELSLLIHLPFYWSPLLYSNIENFHLIVSHFWEWEIVRYVVLLYFSFCFGVYVSCMQVVVHHQSRMFAFLFNTIFLICAWRSFFDYWRFTNLFMMLRFLWFSNKLFFVENIEPRCFNSLASSLSISSFCLDKIFDLECLWASHYEVQDMFESLESSCFPVLPRYFYNLSGDHD